MTPTEAFKVIEMYAQENQRCLRKSVGCMIASPKDNELFQQFLTRNGPARVGFKCTNEVGNCGCCHAEIRAVMEWRDMYGPCTDSYFAQKDWIMLCTYSPCTNCANFIIQFARFLDEVWYQILTEHDVRGRNFLQDAGIKCRYMSAT